jgi:ribosomal-protein-alanine N-acetyltransferase
MRLHVGVTVLTTPRLTLRPIAPGDAAILHLHWDHPEVRRFLFDDRPVAREFVDDIVAESERTFERHRYGMWAVLDDVRIVGVCGLRAGDEGAVELLYSLDPDRWRHGLMTEAARAVLDHAARLGLSEITAETDEANAASARLAERLGMRPAGTRHGHLGLLCRFVTHTSSRENMRSA